MSIRTNLRPTPVITAGAMSGNLTSLPTILQSLTGVGYSLSWTGTSPIGTASVQVSNDYALNPNGTLENAGTWTTISLNVAGTPSTTVAVTGNTGNGFINISDMEAYAIRLIYTAVSGTGTLSAMIVGKVA